MSANAHVRWKCTFSAIVNTQQQQQRQWHLQRRNWCRLVSFHRKSKSQQEYYAKTFYRQYCQSLTRVHTASLCPLYLPIRCYCELSSTLTDCKQHNTNTENIALSNKIERENAESANSLAPKVSHSSELIEPSTHAIVHSMTTQENKKNTSEITENTEEMYYNKINHAKATESICEHDKFHTPADKATVEHIDIEQAQSTDREDAFACKEVNAKLAKQNHDVSRDCEYNFSLSAALFGFTDMRTSVVTHISAAERITREMPLLEKWVKEELFVESNWVNICKEYNELCAKLHDSNASRNSVDGNEENANAANANTNNTNMDVKVNNADHINNNVNDNDNVIDEDDAKYDICVAKTVHDAHSIPNELLNNTRMFVNVIGRPKLLRILLLRYLSHPCLWRDSVDEVLQLAAQTFVGNFERVHGNDDITNRGKLGEDYVSTNNEHDVYVSQFIDSVKTYFANYLNQPMHKLNFYTPALFDKLALFLSTEEIKFSDTSALWDAFVIYNRADTSMLLSPQRPPFSFGELHPTIAREDLHMVELHGESNSCVAGNTTVEEIKTSSELATSPSPSQVSHIDSTCTSSHSNATVTQTNNMNESSNGCSNANNNADGEKNNTHNSIVSESVSSSDIDLSYKQNTIENESNDSSNNCDNSIKNIVVNDVETTTITSTTSTSKEVNNNKLAQTLSTESWEELDEYKQNEILFGKAAAELSLKLRPQNGLYVVHYTNTSNSDEYGSCEYAVDTDDNSADATSASDAPIAAEVQTKDTYASEIHDVEEVTDIALHKISDKEELSVSDAIRSNQDPNLLATPSILQATNLSTNGHESTSQNIQIDCTQSEGVKTNTINEHPKNANTLSELNTELVKDDSKISNDQSIQEANAQVRASNEEHCSNNKANENKEKSNNEDTKQNRNVDYTINCTLVNSNLDDICSSADTLEQSAKEHDDWASVNHLYDIDRLLSSVIERYFDTECSEPNNSENVFLASDIIAPTFMQSDVSFHGSHSKDVDKSYSTQAPTSKLKKQVDLKYSEQQIHKVIGWGLSENATNGKTNKTNTGTSKKRKQRALRELYYTNAHISNSGEQGEVEDLHLSKLWDAFTKTELSELISMYYDVHYRFDARKKEICIELLAQSILLMFFFARDEVRAITAPDKTYYQLWYLHAEICRLVEYLERTCNSVFTRQQCNEGMEQFMPLQENQKELQEHQHQEHESNTIENQQAKHAEREAAIRWSIPHFPSLPYEVQLSYTCFGISHLLGKHTPLTNEQIKVNITQSENNDALQWQKWENEQEFTLQEEVLSKETTPELEQSESKSVSPFSLFCSLLKVYEHKNLSVLQKKEESHDNDICDNSNERDCITMSQLSNEELHKWFDSLTIVQRKAIEFWFDDENVTNAEEQESKESIAEHNTCKANQPQFSLTLAESIATISPLLPLPHEQLHFDKECETQFIKVDAEEEKINREEQLEEKSEPEQEQVQREECTLQINVENVSKCVQTDDELLQSKKALQTKLKHSVFALVRDILYNLFQSGHSISAIEHTEQEESNITSDSITCLNAWNSEYSTDVHEQMTCLDLLARLSPELQNTSISQQINEKILFDVISTAISKHICPLITPLLEELKSKFLEHQPLKETKQLECNKTESCKSNIHANSFAKDVRNKRKYTKRSHLDKLHDMKEVRRTRRKTRESKRQIHQLQEENVKEHHEEVKQEEKRNGLRKRKRTIKEEQLSEFTLEQQQQEQQQLQATEEKLKRRRSAHCKVKRQSKKITERRKVERNNKNKESRHSAQCTEEEELELKSIATPLTPLTKNKRKRTKADSESVNGISKTQSRRRKRMPSNNRNVDQEESLVVLKPKRQYRRREKIIGETSNEAQVSNNLSATFSANENTSHHHNHLREDESAYNNIEHNAEAQDVDDYQEISL